MIPRFRRLSARWILPAIALVQGLAQQPSGSTPSTAESLKDLSLEQLSQIEITSVTKEAVPAFKTPAAVSVLTNEQIRRSGARTLPDLLRLIPGVNVAQIDSNSWAIGIRGFEGALSKSVLVLIDGRSVYTPLFAGVYWDMQDVLIDDIDRIEVIRGPGGTIWGSNAVNGVINIITKNARDTHGMLAKVESGNLDQGEVDWRYGGGGDNLSYRLYGKGFTVGPEQHFSLGNFDDWRRGQIGFRIDSRPGTRDELTVQGDAYGGEAGEILNISSYSPPANPAVEGNESFNGENILTAWRRVLSSGADVQIRAYWDRTNREELNYGEIRNTFDVDFIHHLPFNRNDVTWGLGAKISPSDFFQLVPTVSFFPAKSTYNIFSAFLQDEIALIPDRLSVTIGSKLEYTTYSRFDAQPSVRMSWTPDDKQTVWASVTRAVRTASRIEQGFDYTALIQSSLPLYVRLIGDGAFSPEQLIAYELGYRHYISKHGFIGVSLFHNRYTDLLSVENKAPFVETNPPPLHLVLPLYLRNGIAANSSGGEISALWDLRSWWRLRGSYALVLLDARHEPGSDDLSTIGQLEGDTPKNTVVLQSSFQLPKHFNLDFDYRYVSSISDQKVPAYSTGDARIGWRPKETGWELEAVGQNLFQPWHFEYGGLAGGLIGIKRSLYGGVTWRH
jgi:iron complex outermembrane recepter protein